MYIYNITTNVSEKIHLKWLEWMNETFIPAMLATKKFTKALITEVLVDEDMGGITYSTQYFFENEEDIEIFTNEFQEKILATHTNFKGMYVDFSTKLKVVKEH